MACIKTHGYLELFMRCRDARDDAFEHGMHYALRDMGSFNVEPSIVAAAPAERVNGFQTALCDNAMYVKNFKRGSQS